MRIAGREIPRKWLAPALSALVLPGAGQLFQRRWFAGLFYAGLFLPLAARFFWVGGAYMVECLRAIRRLFSGGAWNPEAASAGGREMAFWFLLCAVVWGMSLLDVWLAMRRQSAGGSPRAIPPLLRKP